MEYEVITELSDKDVFNIAHKFTTLKGSEWKPNEIDFLFAFVSEIQNDDEQFKFYKLTRTELNRKLDKRIEKARIAKLFRAMLNKKIETETDKEIIHYNIFSTLKYNKESEELSVKFNDDLKPLLLKLKPFTKGYLSDLFKMESSYAKRMYLLCSQWQRAGSFRVKVEQLMNDLQVSKSLRVYADFKRKVLKVAQKNMIEKSSIYFEFEEQKKGKKVVELLFTIHKNPKFEKKKEDNQPSLIKTEPTEQDLIKLYLNQKIYVQDKLFFFENLVKNKDANSKDYNKYILRVKDPRTGQIGSLQLQTLELINAIEIVKEMMKGE